MKKSLLILPFLFAARGASADGFSLTAGYDFLRGFASRASVAYNFNQALAIEATIVYQGKEEEITKPGPEYTVDPVVFYPVDIAILPHPILLFAEGGIVFGGGKNGQNGGIGAELPLTTHWSMQVQWVAYHVTEDVGEGYETEYKGSLEVKYRF